MNRLPATRALSCNSSQSGHSADASAGEGDFDSDAERRRPVPPVVTGVVGDRAGESIAPVGSYNSRDDVGTVCILSGNWGGNRSSQLVANHVNNDIKKGFATILVLQEAQPELLGVLRAPSVEGIANSPNPLLRRPSYKYDCVSGTEQGNTLLVASRTNHTRSITRIQWRRRVDGEYKDKGGHFKQAITRVLVAHVAFHKPVAGHSSFTICNVHFHHLAAKKARGMADTHNRFWQELAALIRDCGVQVLAGDFNMSLFCVVPQLRQQGIIVNTAAWFPWVKVSTDKVHLDSCGVFVIGGVTSIKQLCNPFEHHHGHGVQLNENSEDEHEGDPTSDAQAPRPNLQHFNSGQGYECTSYLPKTEEQVLAAIKETLTLSVEGPNVRVPLPQPRPFPPVKQKNATPTFLTLISCFSGQVSICPWLCLLARTLGGVREQLTEDAKEEKNAIPDPVRLLPRR